MNKKPKHVAIIMDGNGRWAQKQGKKRFLGHKKGAKVVKEIVEEATKNEIEFFEAQMRCLEKERKAEGKTRRFPKEK